MTKPTYEWLIEVIDPQAGDPLADEAEILDVHHADTLAEARRLGESFTGSGEGHARYALVRDSDRDDRAWAYFTKEGFLPRHMRDSGGMVIALTPVRFLREAGQ